MTKLQKLDCIAAFVMALLAWLIQPGIAALLASFLAFNVVLARFAIRNLQRRLDRYETPRCRTTINGGAL